MSQPLRKTIFVACRQLGLDEEARRDLQLQVCGKTSMSDMSEDDFKAVVARLKSDGFEATSKGHLKHPRAPRADLRLVHVLWRKLGQAGALQRSDRDGLNAFVRSQFEGKWGAVPADIDMLRDGAKIEAVIAALRAWGKRAGIDFDFNRRAGS